MTSRESPLPDQDKLQVGNLETLNPMIRNFSRLARWLTSRMGSMRASVEVQVANEDREDDDVAVSEPWSWSKMLRRCESELSELPARVTRVYLDCPGPHLDNDQSSFRVLQWNILSQALGEVNDNFVACPAGALSWKTRRWRLLEEMASARPDILCLQEVDHFRFLEMTLGPLGFRGLFLPKPDSPCLYVDGNNGPDGCAIFWNQNRFELSESRQKVLEVWGCNSNQVALMVLLDNKDRQGEGVRIVTTHLKARQGTLLTSLRHEQGKDLLRWVREFHEEGGPLILAGDFNAEPCEPVYRAVLSEGALGLRSSYGSEGNEPPYTTWKIREDGEVCHTIDYLFYSPRTLGLRRLLALPSGEDIGPQRLPSYSYPSDHLSMVAEFAFISRSTL